MMNLRQGTCDLGNLLSTHNNEDKDELPTLMAVAPASTYVLPTTTVVMRPDPPPVTVNGCPEPSNVMTGGVMSGAENRSAVAAAAAEIELVDVLPPPLPPVRSAARAAACDPQFPLTLQAYVALLLQVFSDGPHGSKTVNVRMPVMDCVHNNENFGKIALFGGTKHKYTTTNISLQAIYT